MGHLQGSRTRPFKRGRSAEAIGEDSERGVHRSPDVSTLRKLVSGSLGKSMGPKAIEDVNAPVGHALAGGS